jgi:hypothetical protein
MTQMTSRLKQCALVVTPILAAAALVHGRAAQRPVPVVAQPEHWVAFTADSVWVDETGTARYERIYRSADGSTRFEGYLSPDMNELQGIAIKNISQVRYFVWRKNAGWTSQPMQLPPGGWVPRPRRADSVTSTGQAVEGLEVVKAETDGFTQLYAPALNMFTVYQEIRNCGGSDAVCTTRVFNIRIVEQPRELFELPGDAIPILLDQPGGIVQGTRQRN